MLGLCYTAEKAYLCSVDYYAIAAGRTEVLLHVVMIIEIE